MSKYYVFTMNNYTGMLGEGNIPEDMTYLCFQEEIGASGTPHLQGYLELKKQYRKPALQDLLQTFHWDPVWLGPRKGTAEQARDYCNGAKEDPLDRSVVIENSFVEFGIISKSNQGRRTDLENAMEAIRGGSTMHELNENHSHAMAKYGRFMMNYRIQHYQNLMEVEEFIPRGGWQLTESMLLMQDPNNRTIRWIWDPIGKLIIL